ncbi:Uncharacterized protein SCF082_LOCUS12246 [Durusdinium trenchii]|uniref:Cilia- and flagella-associated protein 206 n=1 Tax=Durusdinium trenchii TaxID=1381693 RepID=A0ABP0JIH1_9DINO
MQFVILVGQWAHTEGEQAVEDLDRLENFCEFLAKVVKKMGPSLLSQLFLDFWVLGRRASCSLQGIPPEALDNITSSSIGALPSSRRGLIAVLELPLYIVQCELRAATALVEEWLLLTEHGSELEIHVALLKEALCDLTLIVEGELLDQGFKTFGALAFAVSATPQALTDEALAISDLQRRVEPASDAGGLMPKKLPMAERQARQQEQEARLAGVIFSPETQPSHSLVDTCVHMIDQNVLTWLKPEECTSRAQEIQSLKKDPKVSLDSEGNLKISTKPTALTCSVSSALDLRNAWQRRSLAFDQARICSFRVMETWVQHLFLTHDRVQPTGFAAVSTAQMIECDKQLFIRASNQLVGALQVLPGAPRPLDAVLTSLMHSPDLATFLLPLPQKASQPNKPAKRQASAGTTNPPPAKKPNKGKGKGRGKSPASNPTYDLPVPVVLLDLTTAAHQQLLLDLLTQCPPAYVHFGLPCGTASRAAYPVLLAERMSAAVKSYLLGQGHAFTALPPLRTHTLALQHRQHKSRPHLIPEFAQVVWLPDDAPIPSQGKLLPPGSHGGKGPEEHEPPNSRRVGIFHTPEEFVAKAMIAKHPMDERGIERITLEAVDFVKNSDPKLVDIERKKNILKARTLAKRLEAEESALHKNLDPAVQKVVQDKKILLWKKLLEEANYDDMEKKIKMAEISEEQLRSTARWRRKALISRRPQTEEPGFAEHLMETASEEVDLGFLQGPFKSEEEVTAILGHENWSVMRRFVIQQGQKLRPIDDGLEAQLNAAYTSTT